MLPADRALRALTRDPREWVAVGIVSEVLGHDVWGIEVVGELADGTEFSARPAGPALRAAAGELPKFAAGEEVVLLFPGGDRNAAIVLHERPANDGQGPGPTYDNDDDTRQRFGREDVAHKGGEGGDGVAPESVVLAPFLDDLSTLLGALTTYLDAQTGMTPGNEAANATALGAIKTAAGTLKTAVGTLKTAVDKSKNRVDGRAGYPHASDLLRAGNTATR